MWLVAGVTDMRKGFGGLSGLSALVQTALQFNPFSGHLFVFRGRRGDLIKILWRDGDGLCLFAKRQCFSDRAGIMPACRNMLTLSPKTTPPWRRWSCPSVVKSSISACWWPSFSGSNLGAGQNHILPPRIRSTSACTSRIRNRPVHL